MIETKAIIDVLQRHPAQLQSIVDVARAISDADATFFPDLIAAIDPQATGVIAALKSNPDTLAGVLRVFDDGTRADVTVLPDLLAAVGTRGYMRFALQHPRFVAQVVAIVSNDPTLLAAIEHAIGW